METQTQEPSHFRPAVASSAADSCGCRAHSAFQYWRDQTLTPALNWEIDFTSLVNVPPGKRAVIELVTATIQVPAGESARLRMSTSLGSAPSNLDLTAIPQHALGSARILMVTHALRAYSDHDISFKINRDNAETTGYALICISGHFVDA